MLVATLRRMTFDALASSIVVYERYRLLRRPLEAFVDSSIGRLPFV